jgi:hypothetical protein
MILKNDIFKGFTKVGNKSLLFIFLIIFMLILCCLGNAADNITVNINTGDYNITKDNEGFDIIVIEGASQLFIPGNPMLPSKKIDILLPPDVNESSLELDVISGHTRVLDGIYEIKPSPEISYCEDNTTKSYSYRVDKDVFEQDFENTLLNDRNYNVYGTDTNYPEESVTLLPPSQMRKWKFVSVNFVPFQYNPVQKRLTLTYNITIKLYYSRKAVRSALAQSFAADTVMDYLAPQKFLNYNEACSWYAKPSNLSKPSLIPPLSYVIITTNAIRAGSTKLNSFIAQKQSLGYNVRVVTEDDFNGLTGQPPNQRAEKIREWLIRNYLSMGIKYVLLIGNPTPYGSPFGTVGEGDIPMKLCHPIASDPAGCPTDYFYADLTGKWDINGNQLFGEWEDYSLGGVDFAADVFVGRIPVFNADYGTLDHILQKIIDYENSNDVEWRKSALLPMGFWTSNGDAAPLGEALRDNCLQPNGYTSWRMYLEGSGPCSLDSFYSCEEELRGEPYSERGPTKVGDRWIANRPGIVCWAGHGGQGWTDVGYDECNEGFLFADYECTRLNDNYPAFVFSCSCDNARAENNVNLIYLILKNGGVSTIGASRGSFFLYPLPKEAIPASYTNEGIGYEYMRRLVQSLPGGDALYGALDYVKDPDAPCWLHSILEFNLYGDPSLSLLPDAYVQELGTFDGSNWNYRPIGTETGSVPAAYDSSMASTWDDGNPRVYYFGRDLHVRELGWTGSSWFFNDLNFPLDPPTLVASGGLTATILSDNPRVYYTASNHVVHELLWSGTTWYEHPVKPDAKLSSGLSIASTTVAGGTLPRVYYMGYDASEFPYHTPHELAWDGSYWNYLNLAVAASSPTDHGSQAQLTSTLCQGNPRVYYTGADQKVRELRWQSSTGWIYLPIGVTTGAPKVHSSSALASTTLGDGNPRVYYFGEDRMVKELGWTGTWNYVDCGTAAGAPPAYSGGLEALTATTKNGQPRIYYVAEDRMIVEIGFDGSSWFHKHIGSNTGAIPYASGGITSTTYNGNPRVYYLGVTNRAPNTPSIPSGPTTGMPGTSYSYSTSAIDPNGDQVKYTFDWTDGTTSTTGLVNSGIIASKSHSWSSTGTKLVKAKATDCKSAASGWSNSLSVAIKFPVASSDIGLFRPSTARWYLDYDNNGASNYQVTWGASTDKPVAGDWDGDGKDEIGLFRPSTARWYLDYDNNGASNYQVTWGASTDIPVAGDWDGDGKDEIGLFRPSTARWYLDYDNNGASNYQVTWGASTDIPVAGCWS